MIRLLKKICIKNLIKIKKTIKKKIIQTFINNFKKNIFILFYSFFN